MGLDRCALHAFGRLPFAPTLLSARPVAPQPNAPRLAAPPVCCNILDDVIYRL